MPQLGLSLGTRWQRVLPSLSFLSEFPGAVFAYSLQDISGKNLNVVRVRRGTDNAESDFKESDIIDGSLSAFCEGGTGFVSVWYDQTESGNNFVQTVANEQPRIVNLGSVETFGGKPAIRNLGTSFSLDLSSRIDFASDFSIYYSASHTSFGTSVSFLTRGFTYLRYNTSAFNPRFGAINSGNIDFDTTLITNTKYLLSFDRASSVITANINGSDQSNTGTNTGLFSVDQIFRRATNTSQTFSGYAYELIGYGATQANKSQIIDNINSRYDIF